MSPLVRLQELPSQWEPQLAKPLDEAVWQAWLLKGRSQDSRSGAARVKSVKWVSAAVLLAAAGLWSYPTPYDVLVRFIVTLGAMAVMFQAFHARQYTFVAVFGVLVLLYNPVAPVFSFSGGWQRIVVFASAFPFVASLGWSNAKLAHND